MATNHPSEGDDFLDQILSIPSYTGNDANLAGNDPSNLPPNVPTSMVLQLSSSSSADGVSYHHHHHHHHHVQNHQNISGFPLGLSLEQGKSGFYNNTKPDEASGSSGIGMGGKRFHHDDLTASSGNHNDRESVLFPVFGHVQQTHTVRPAAAPQVHQTFHGHPNPGPVAAVPHPPSIRPRVRARRGQATDPHSIAERLRRERIAERMKALQELVPSSNKTDRAAMLDEIVDYVKFLRLQVKVLSMSRLGGAGAVAQLVADIPLSSGEGVAGGDGGSGNHHPAWEKWSADGTEHQVAKLMEEDVGAAMQYLQSKALCIMPVSLASAIYHTHQSDIKPEQNTPS